MQEIEKDIKSNKHKKNPFSSKYLSLTTSDIICDEGCSNFDKIAIAFRLRTSLIEAQISNLFSIISNINSHKKEKTSKSKLKVDNAIYADDYKSFDQLADTIRTSSTTDCVTLPDIDSNNQWIESILSNSYNQSPEYSKDCMLNQYLQCLIIKDNNVKHNFYHYQRHIRPFKFEQSCFNNCLPTTASTTTMASTPATQSYIEPITRPQASNETDLESITNVFEDSYHQARQCEVISPPRKVPRQVVRRKTALQVDTTIHPTSRCAPIEDNTSKSILGKTNMSSLLENSTKINDCFQLTIRNVTAQHAQKTKKKAFQVVDCKNLLLSFGEVYNKTRTTDSKYFLHLPNSLNQDELSSFPILQSSLWNIRESVQEVEQLVDSVATNLFESFISNSTDCEATPTDYQKKLESNIKLVEPPIIEMCTNNSRSERRSIHDYQLAIKTLIEREKRTQIRLSELSTIIDENAGAASFYCNYEGLVDKNDNLWIGREHQIRYFTALLHFVDDNNRKSQRSDKKYIITYNAQETQVEKLNNHIIINLLP